MRWTSWSTSFQVSALDLAASISVAIVYLCHERVGEGICREKKGALRRQSRLCDEGMAG